MLDKSALDKCASDKRALNETDHWIKQIGKGTSSLVPPRSAKDAGFSP